MNAAMIPTDRPLEPHLRAIVLGASSGLGAELVRQLCALRYKVAAVARREEALASLRQSVGPDSVRAYVHDVTEFDQVPMLFDRITADLGGLDLIVYCAAVQPRVAANEYDFAKDEAMINTNLLGAIAWLNQAAVRFERRRAGHIVGISSIAGERGRVGAWAVGPLDEVLGAGGGGGEDVGGPCAADEDQLGAEGADAG